MFVRTATFVVGARSNRLNEADSIRTKVILSKPKLLIIMLLRKCEYWHSEHIIWP